MPVLIIPQLSEGDVARIQAAAPGVELRAAASPAEAEALACDADACFGFMSPALCRAGSRLRWVQVASAGIERYGFPELVNSDIVLTNASGTYGSHLAEHLLAFILAFSRNFHLLFPAQQERRWMRRSEVPAHELAGETVLIVGLGGTGRDLARKTHALGMRVVAATRTPKPGEECVDRLVGMDQLHEVLPDADYVALCCAYTRETHHLFGAPEFARMKPTAYITNVARGGVIDQEALIAALAAGEIAGAGLDVTTPEPLPADHPLWTTPNVLITPHSSGHSPHSDRRLMDLLCENLRRFTAGEPLLNEVDKQRDF